MRSHICFHCHQPLSQVEYGAEVWSKNFSPDERVVMTAMVRAKGRHIMTERLAGLVYADRDVKNSKALTQVVIHRINLKIIDVGYRIVGFRDRGYALVKCPAKMPLWDRRNVVGDPRKKSGGRPKKCD